MTIWLDEREGEPFGFDCRALAERVVRAAAEAAHFPYEAEVSLSLVDDGEIRALNRQYRNNDSVTDVLSFPMVEFPKPGDCSGIEEGGLDFNPDTGEAMLGDIVICAGKAREQAKDYGHSQEREVAFLILHGMLHLLGYDHMEEGDARQMEEMQREILARIGIPR